ncbi:MULTISPECIES: histidine--tRNA ligase [Thermomonospora]|uniref:Histidine--tRNA ligase n=1 Tax=Thermomonospora curvata (strain ATCC 19995 / DSM 43183 / JCM 3096 / KCTC 9072 / NBRC 15933 / NCIMB 10081 / Henssen B9) TaxID=471852 RepID=D1AEW2_THECD|nr:MULTISPECIES: histidine--tRNA ligase [Thermomonospora]ACY97687.1 histidyl-tRNA synthetase [Thermomonospora curvata DSM 43183]PKK14430.1 MAG: histidine--tRNA ligase [Thermomonospora sp. CIF 1]
MSSSFQAPKGVSEYVPPQAEALLAVRQAFAEQARLAGYGYVELAVFEDTQLFKRGVGESTDVVTKEMYTFEDRGGRSITLRPEFTAGVLRAVLEYGLHKQGLPVKVWTTGPAFRAERPQKGRYRQFYQLDLEAIGSQDPQIDAETIAIAWNWYQGLGLRQVRLLLNSLGCRECRPAYRTRLQEFLRGLDLDEATRARVEINPLRVLDDKRPEVKAQLTDAPLMADHLCAACKAHHDKVRSLLADVGIAWTDEPRLVRGLDYYTRTTYEFEHPLLGAQSGIGGGGRYDGLSEDIGGPPLPGIGFGLGLDRTLLALEAEGVQLPVPSRCQVFGVPLGETAEHKVFTLVAELRRAGIAADMAPAGKSLKSAMKSADRSGAAYAVIIGERDITAGSAQVKDLATGEQIAVPLTDLTATLLERIGR